jgi:uncharacterized alkaline shock family protein YloU
MAETNLSMASDATAVKKESNGTITFASEVIATIAGLAAIDIKGVAGMSGGFVDGFVELLGRKNLTKGIKVEVGSEEVAVDIAIVVDYGIPIQGVAENIQNSVIKAVETMTGLKVVEVNVSVQGIKIQEQHMPQGGGKQKQKPEPSRVK